MDFNELCEYHGPNLAAPNDTNLEGRQGLLILYIDCHFRPVRLLNRAWRLLALESCAYRLRGSHIGLSETAAAKGIQDLPVDARQIDTLEHDNVSNDFTSEEGVLQVLIWNKVIEPALSKLGDSCHGEEMRGLQLRAEGASFIVLREMI